jgi:hypothetical protein
MQMSNETNIVCVNTCFRNNLTIKGVDCGNLPWYSNSMAFAFQGCSNLESVTNLNQNIRLMGYSFANCTNLVNAPVIPNSVVNMPSAFANCFNLVNAPSIPNGVVIMSSTFMYCNNLVNAPEIPNSVTNMQYTFGHCHNLVNAPEIPNSVTNMQYAFYTCKNLITAPSIPNGVVNMAGTFFQCYNLTTTPNIPSTVVNMANTFLTCTNLVSGPSIPNSVDDMTGTFYQCSKLETIPSIGNSVVIMARTFCGCSNITAIPNIPSTVVNMYQTFYDCSNIQSDIFIHSANVENASGCLTGVSNINVYIPFNYNISQTLYCYSGTDMDTGEVFSVYLKTGTVNELIEEVYDNLGNQVSGYGSIEPYEDGFMIQLETEDGMFYYCEDGHRNRSGDIVINQSSEEHTTTYNSFISAGYDENGTTDGICLKDINSYENPDDPSSGLPINTSVWSYEQSGNDILLTDYIGQDTNIKVLE